MRNNAEVVVSFGRRAILKNGMLVLTATSLTCLMTVLCCHTAQSQENDFNAYPEQVANYLKRIYDQKQQTLAYRKDDGGGFDKWQREARESLRQKIGLPKIAASVGEHQRVVTLDAPEDLGEYWRQSGVIETEPDVRIPFWLLIPKSDGPWPLGVFHVCCGNTGIDAASLKQTNDGTTCRSQRTVRKDCRTERTVSQRRVSSDQHRHKKEGDAMG